MPRRLVCGVNHTGIQRKLLAHADLTYHSAYMLALSVEASERDTKTLLLQRSDPSSDPTPPQFITQVHADGERVVGPNLG